MFELRTCKRDNFCYECDNKECALCGDIGADCPKWKCDMPDGTECEHCSWITCYIDRTRAESEEV